MATFAPILANDISTILAKPTIDPIAIAAVLDPNCPIITDDGHDVIIKFNAPTPKPPPILQPHHQVECDAKAIASTQVDWRETPTKHVFQVDLPGINRSKIIDKKLWFFTIKFRYF